MKDLDFDELDRAVNSLMTNVPETRDSSKPEEAEKTLDITPTLAVGDTPSFAKLNDATVKTTGAPVAQTSPLPSPSPLTSLASRPAAVATRRGGRFMDVVHPSSDMKKPTVPARPTVSRQGVTVAPTARTEVTSQPLPSPTPPPSAETLSRADIEPSTVSVPSAPTTHEPATPVSEWPDPLEMANFKDTPIKPEAVAKPEKLTLKEKMTEPEEKLLEEPSPLTSPFLSGTKVDKRPLGGSVPDPTEEPDRVPVFGARAKDDLASTDPESQLPPTPTPKDNELELPEELKGDLMAIEADTTTHHVAPAPEKAEAPAVEEKPDPELKKPVHVSIPKPMPQSEEKLLMAGPTSIPQQYREEPNTGDKDNGAIYDTDSYHQPLTHPAKKKSGWLWVLWIVIILVLGAGGGAALYFFGII